MRVSSIAFANLKRRSGRAVFLSLGMALGVATVVALVTLTAAIRDEIEAQLDQFGANIVIAPKANNVALDYGGVAVPGVAFDIQELHDEDVQRIRSIPYRSRLSVVAPKILSSVGVEGAQRVIAGVDFKNELKLKRWWQISGNRPTEEKDLLLGYDTAHQLGVIHVADAKPSENHQHESSERHELHLLRETLTIAGIEHHVAGVIGPTGGAEDRMLFGELQHVQELTKKQGHLDVIEVSALCKGCPIDDIVAQIQQVLPNARVSAIQQSVRTKTEMVNRLTRFSTVISGVVLLIGALLIFTTMTSSVAERTKEIGVVRALGFRRMHVIQQFMVEIAIVSAVGGCAGWIIGSLAGQIAVPYFTEAIASSRINIALLAGSIAAALLVGTLSTVYPALRASKLEPSEAVRYV